MTLLALALAVQLPLAEAGDALARGDYAAAEAGFRAGLPDPRAEQGLAETLRITGRYREALEVARGLQRARIHLEIGEDEDALPLLRAVSGEVLAEWFIAEVALAGIAARRGEDPRPRLEGVLAAYERVPAESLGVPALLAVGEALVRLGYLGSGLVRDALQAFDRAAALDPDARLPRLLAAELLAEKGNASEAAREFQAVLDRNPHDPRALLGAARMFLGGEEDEEDPLDAALRVNPRLPAARALKVVRLLEADDTEAALAQAAAAVAELPRSPDALGAHAAALFLTGDTAGAAAVEERFLAAFPGDPRLDLAVGFAAESIRRYREAVARADAALARDPASVAALRLRGLNQLRFGAMEAGRASLTTAFERDPFDVFVKNTLDMLDELDTFTVIDSPPFELVLPPSQADLLGPYLERVAHQALDAYRERYQFEPAETIRIEVYDRSAEFSVRTVGMTGIGAHGVCFGNVIAMESPSARQMGEYHWLSTMWHELAHTVTMGLTDNRIPRWFTEGLSQMEERARFGEGAPLGFYRALAEGGLLPMEELDEGFLRPTQPGQVRVSYYHSAVVMEHWRAVHGFPALLAMLDGFARGGTTREVIPQVLGEPLTALDAGVHAEFRALHGDAAAGLDEPQEPAEIEEVVRRADDRPGDFVAQLAAGYMLESADRDAEAVPYLEQAFALAPHYGGFNSASAALARIHQRAGRTGPAAEALERHLALVPSDHAGWVRLSELREADGDPVGAAAALEEGVLAWPLERDPHERLADLFAQLGEHAGEIRERRAVLATEPPDRAGALYRLAAAHRRAGDPGRARRRVLEALEIAPTYRDALTLLRELREAGS